MEQHNGYIRGTKVLADNRGGLCGEVVLSQSVHWDMDLAFIFQLAFLSYFGLAITTGTTVRVFTVPVISAEVPSSQSFDFHLQLSGETRPTKGAECGNGHVIR